MATGGTSSASPAKAMMSSASGGPSTSTQSASSSSRAARTLRAEPGPWCRMPRTLTGIAAGPVEVLPALLDDGLQVLAPDDLILHRVLDHRALEAGGDVASAQGAVAEVRGQRQAARHHRDRLGRRQRRRWRLELGLAVGRDAGAELAEDGDHPPDLVPGRRLGGELEGAPEIGDPPLDDGHLVVEVVGERQDDGVEAALERARQLVHAAVAAVGGGDDVEAMARLHLLAELGDRDGLLGEEGDERVLDVRGDARQ